MTPTPAELIEKAKEVSACFTDASLERMVINSLIAEVEKSHAALNATQVSAEDLAKLIVHKIVDDGEGYGAITRLIQATMLAHAQREQELLHYRDQFIVENRLWDKFVESLRNLKGS